MEAHLIPSPDDPLESSLRCAGACPTPIAGWRDDTGRLMVAENLPDRLRRSLVALPPEERPARIVLAPHGGVDPLGPDPYLQSAAFLTASAALEAGVGVALLTRGVA